MTGRQTYSDFFERWTRPDLPKRVESLDELKVGQIVTWQDTDGYWHVGRSPINAESLKDWSAADVERGVVILSQTEPPRPPIEQGPGDDSDVESGRCCPHCRHLLTEHNKAVYAAAYAMYRSHGEKEPRP
jgi:hypothetical protein